MSIILRLVLVAAMLFSIGNAQPNSCIDVNSRILYTNDRQAELVLMPVSPSISYMSGRFNDGTDSSLILSKTISDSIVWTKGFKTNTENFQFGLPSLLPNNKTLFGSDNGTNNRFFLTSTDPNGNIIWSKQFQLSAASNMLLGGPRNVAVTKNAIYLNAGCALIRPNIYPNNCITMICKIDFDGNIVWTKFLYYEDLPRVYAHYSLPVVENNDTLTLISQFLTLDKNNYQDSLQTIFTKLSTTSGGIYSAHKLKGIANNYFRGVNSEKANQFADGSIYISGRIASKYPFDLEISPNSFYRAVYILNRNGEFQKGNYFESDAFFYNSNANFYYYNQSKKLGFLAPPLPGLNNNTYFLTVGSDLNIEQTRYFKTRNYFHASSSFYDDDETMYFNFSGTSTNGKGYLEHARISKYAPTNSLDCFGRDTIIATTHPFTMVRDTFQWLNDYNATLLSTPVLLTEGPFTIQQQTICTQTSICDTIKVKGPQSFCTNDQNIVFSVYKNPRCMRPVKWQADTTVMRIIPTENGDSVHINFKKAYNDYIKASFEGCTLADSIYVEATEPLTDFSLGKDSILCPGKGIVLNAPKGFNNYQWQDGSTYQTFTATQPGNYHVTVTDNCNNSFTDTITVLPMDVEFHFNDPAVICSYDSASILLPQQLSNFNWLPYNDAMILQNKLLFFPKSTTTFTITANRFTNCQLNDTILITVKDCPNYLQFPNAFSPNNDGINDIFKPLAAGRFEQYELSIYNRYGQRVFRSISVSKGWDGNFAGQKQNSATFVWVCRYQLKNESPRLEKGAVTIIR